MTFVEVMESPQKPAAAVPGARTRATRVLLAVAALLLCAPMAWLVTATLTVKQMSLSRVQVRLNFAALIDWSTEGPSMSADSTCSQVREPWCLLCWRSQVLHLLLLLPWTRAAAAEAALAEAPPSLEDLLLPAIPLEQQERQGLYRDLIVPLYDLSRQPVGTVTLGGDIFDVPIRRDILHRVVRWQLAKRQQGTHKTKTRSEVRGGGRKPRPQKGSGRSRQGTIRAPQW